MRHSLDALAVASGFSPAGREVQVSSVTDDSRLVEPGTLFVAYRGVHADGHSFVQEAVLRGAVAVVAEHPVSVDVPL